MEQCVGHVIMRTAGARGGGYLLTNLLSLYWMKYDPECLPHTSVWIINYLEYYVLTVVRVEGGCGGRVYVVQMDEIHAQHGIT